MKTILVKYMRNIVSFKSVKKINLKIKCSFSKERPPVKPTFPSQGASATSTPRCVTSTWPCTWRQATWAEACATTVNTTPWGDSASSAPPSSSSTRTETRGTQTSASVSHPSVTLRPSPWPCCVSRHPSRPPLIMSVKMHVGVCFFFLNKHHLELFPNWDGAFEV